VIAAMVPSKATEARPPRKLPVTFWASRVEHVGGTFPAVEGTAASATQFSDGIVPCEIVGSRVPTPTKGIWLDPRTCGNVSKTIRALKIHILRQTANVTCSFLGAGSKTLTMVFTLRKFPSKKKTLQILLPHTWGQTTDGLFLRTARGQKVLCVQFGRGDMEVDALIKNATAVLHVVAKALDNSLVHDITVDVDRLSLPVWNRRLWDRGRRKRTSDSAKYSERMVGTMGPPVGLPLKRARVS